MGDLYPCQYVSVEDKSAGDEKHRGEEWRRASLSRLYHTVLGVKDSAVLVSPALLALHLAHLLHSYRKISADLQSCAGMALME